MPKLTHILLSTLLTSSVFSISAYSMSERTEMDSTPKIHSHTFLASNQSIEDASEYASGKTSRADTGCDSGDEQIVEKLLENGEIVKKLLQSPVSVASVAMKEQNSTPIPSLWYGYAKVCGDAAEKALKEETEKKECRQAAIDSDVRCNVELKDALRSPGSKILKHLNGTHIRRESGTEMIISSDASILTITEVIPLLSPAKVSRKKIESIKLV